MRLHVPFLALAAAATPAATATAPLLLLLATAPAPAFAQASSSSGIVDEAVRDAEREQRRDQEKVRDIVKEAVEGAESAPSGQVAVTPPPADTLAPLAGDQAGAALPPGVTAQDLLDQPVQDGSGTQIGKVAGLVIDHGSGLARAMVAFTPVFGEPGKTAPVELDTLRPTSDGSPGYIVDITPIQYQALPAYSPSGDGHWRRDGA